MAPTVALALAQRRLGHTVWLGIDTRRGNFNGYEEAALPRVTAAGLLPPVPLTLSTRAPLRTMLKDLQQLRTFCAAQVDVVHAHFSHDHVLMTFVRPASRLRRIRTIHAARSLQRRLGQAWAARQVDGWVVRCAHHAERLARAFRVEPQRIKILGGNVDRDVFVPATPAQQHAARRAFGLPIEARCLGQASLLAGRGQEELLAAVARLGPTAPHVVLAGRGEREASLRRMVATLGLQDRVHFIGYVQTERLPEFYAALDAAYIGVLGNDASGRAGLEALACALPVIAAPEGALAEVVAAHGYTFATRAPADIAAALRQWLADLHAPARGAAGRAWILAQRQVDHEAQATLALY